MIYGACKIIPRCTKAISILQVSQRSKRLNDFTDLCIQATVKTLFELIVFETFFQEYHRSIKQFGSRSGPLKGCLLKVQPPEH